MKKILLLAIVCIGLCGCRQETPDEQFKKANSYAENKDFQNAAKYYRKAAERGHAKAQINLGWCYENGNGVDKDLKQAVEWYSKAAEQGDAIAQCNLGVCYHNGTGVGKDLKQSVEWFRKAAEQGNVKAQVYLGGCYYYGIGVKEDDNQAEYWWREANKQGIPETFFAQLRPEVRLLVLRAGTGEYTIYAYVKSEAVRKEFKEILHEAKNRNRMYSLRREAKQGLVSSQYKLGVCYATGDPMALDYEKAVSWFLKAAEQEHAGAQYLLGVCYENGLGVKKDIAQAEYWYRKAANQDDPEAQKALKSLGR